ncbi:MAG: peptidoglycan editing factor PgeF [Deltaproteobacteria bacterium]|nr:peptidoglycan editing factor PgeF [Deltaproteobacteria bacterium]
MPVKDPMQYLASALLPPSCGAAHAFFSRAGGVSAAPFASLNFDPRDGDAAENIERNRIIAGASCGVPMETLVTVNQVHGAAVMRLDASTPGPSPVDADAIVTSLPNVPIGILTADCLPLLLYDQVKKAVGAVHAGWRGTVSGVSTAAVSAMRDAFGSAPVDIIAALGPHIGPCCYTVGNEVFERFSSAAWATAGCVRKDDGVMRVDIGAANVAQLISTGLSEENISRAAPCTSCTSGLFFSYRKEAGRTGRQLSFIMLR